MHPGCTALRRRSARGLWHALLWHIRRRSFSDSLILTSNFQSPLPLAMVLQLAGVPRVVGVSDDYPGSLLDLRLFIDRDLHEAERGLAIAEGAGYRGDGPELRVLPDLPCVRWPGRADPFVVVHPGADAPARQWPPESAQRAVELLAVAGFQVVVTGSSQERALTRTVAGERGIDLGGATTLAELAGVLRDCRAVVVGNTGPAHLAAAVGTPIVSLFAPVVPAHKWAPYAGRVRVLGDQGAACADTRARECPIPGHPCLGSVTADEVATAVKALVGAAA